MAVSLGSVARSGVYRTAFGKIVSQLVQVCACLWHAWTCGLMIVLPHASELTQSVLQHFGVACAQDDPLHEPLGFFSGHCQETQHCWPAHLGSAHTAWICAILVCTWWRTQPCIDAALHLHHSMALKPSMIAKRRYMHEHSQLGFDHTI